MATPIISIIGCGWLGIPLAEQLLTEGYRVKGSTTAVEKLALLSEKGIDAYQLGLQPEPVGDLLNLLQADILLIDVPPKAGKLGDDFHPQQIQHLTNAIRSSAANHIIYVSSTSVYPERNPQSDQLVAVEDSVLTPEESAAPGLVRAEKLIQSLASVATDSQRQITIVRCAGLMGYDRIPGKYVAGRTVDSGTVSVNYLHRDDAVGILLTVIQQRLSGTFNAVAPEHPDREAIYRKSCMDFGYELPTFVEPANPVPYKIVSAEKLTQATNYRFKYPDPLQFFYRQ